ncbi:hypothetical protein E2320_005945, partial [Naja naja]
MCIQRECIFGQLQTTLAGNNLRMCSSWVLHSSPHPRHKHTHGNGTHILTRRCALILLYADLSKSRASEKIPRETKSCVAAECLDTTKHTHLSKFGLSYKSSPCIPLLVSFAYKLQ